MTRLGGRSYRPGYDDPLIAGVPELHESERNIIFRAAGPSKRAEHRSECGNIADKLALS